MVEIVDSRLQLSVNLHHGLYVIFSAMLGAGMLAFGVASILLGVCCGRNDPEDRIMILTEMKDIHGSEYISWTRPRGKFDCFLLLLFYTTIPFCPHASIIFELVFDIIHILCTLGISYPSIYSISISQLERSSSYNLSNHDLANGFLFSPRSSTCILRPRIHSSGHHRFTSNKMHCQSRPPTRKGSQAQ